MNEGRGPLPSAARAAARRALLGGALAVVSVATAVAAQSPPPAHDNVLLIVADDVGVDRIEAYGRSPTAGPTPNIDLLAEYGVRFDRAYGSPVCSPTRATILTGRYGFRTGVGGNISFEDDGFELSPDERTLPDVLAATHHTAALGKWHLGSRLGSGYGHPVALGFDVFSGSKEQLGGVLSPPDVFFGWEKCVASPAGDVQFDVVAYSTTEHVDDALTVIGWYGDEPWFVQLAFNAAHAPFHVPPDDLTTIKANSAASVAIKHRAMVEAMDSEIERLLLGIPPEVLERTWVVFLADNGTQGVAVSEKELVNKSKGTIYEGGTAVPLIVMGPGVVGRGRSVDTPVNTTDLFATILDMAGVTLPAAQLPEDSRSLMPMLCDPTHPPVREFAYTELFQPNGFGPRTSSARAVVGQRYKLVELVDAAGERYLVMFDLLQDPRESVDLLAEGVPLALLGPYSELLTVLLENAPDASPPPHPPSTGVRTGPAGKDGGAGAPR